MFSGEHYRTYTAKYTLGFTKLRTVDQICSNDPHYYQGCGLQETYQLISNAEKTFCGCICQNQEFSHPFFLQISMATDRSCEDWISCGKLFTCSNFREYPPLKDGQKCSESKDLVQLRASNTLVSQDDLCNGQCNWGAECEDEAFCNGFHYGMYCLYGENRDIPLYQAPGTMICSSLIDYSSLNRHRTCDIDLETVCMETSKFCLTDHDTSLSSHEESSKLPLLNFTRCTAYISSSVFVTENPRFTLVYLC